MNTGVKKKKRVSRGHEPLRSREHEPLRSLWGFSGGVQVKNSKCNNSVLIKAVAKAALGQGLREILLSKPPSLHQGFLELESRKGMFKKSTTLEPTVPEFQAYSQLRRREWAAFSTLEAAVMGGRGAS